MQPTERRRIGVVEDDPIMAESLVQRLALEGYEPILWREGGEALEHVVAADPHLIICDIRLPDINGEEFYRRALPVLGKRPIIFVTAFGQVEQAVRLMQLGADDYLTKPFSIEVLLEKIAAVAGEHGRGALEPTSALGRSQDMRRIEAMLRRIRDLDTTVLFTGETGVGKEVAARFLHEVSSRRARPFVAVNCAAMPAELIDSALFGHEKGAFTGAHAMNPGFAEAAADGILFLDEIGELPPSLQAKLLRLLQERTFHRVGGTRLHEFSARLVTATNADLGARVEDGTFRKDLYYRLNVIEIRLPPLRERREEIAPLLKQYVQHYAAVFGRTVQGLTPGAETAAQNHDWPGNVRELRNRVERAVALTEGGPIDAADLFPDAAVPDAPAAADRLVTLAEARDAAERQHIHAALRQAEGHVAAAATLLGISRTTLWEKMRRLGIEQD